MMNNLVLSYVANYSIQELLNNPDALGDYWLSHRWWLPQIDPDFMRQFLGKFQEIHPRLLENGLFEWLDGYKRQIASTGGIFLDELDTYEGYYNWNGETNKLNQLTTDYINFCKVKGFLPEGCIWMIPNYESDVFLALRKLVNVENPSMYLNHMDNWTKDCLIKIARHIVVNVSEATVYVSSLAHDWNFFNHHPDPNEVQGIPEHNLTRIFIHVPGMSQPDLTLPDDMEMPENVETIPERTGQVNWFWQSLHRNFESTTIRAPGSGISNTSWMENESYNLNELFESNTSNTSWMENESYCIDELDKPKISNTSWMENENYNIDILFK